MKPFSGIGILLLISLSACIKKDDISLSDSLHITPDYSIPIGPVIFSPNDVTYDLSLVADTSLVDTITYIFYNENYYEADTDYVQVREQLTVDFSGLTNMNNIRYLTFIFINDNFTPLKVYSQLYFLDNNSFIIDSLFENGPVMFPAPEMDINGNILDNSIGIHSVTFDTTDIQNLLNTSVLEILSVVKVIPKDSNIVELDTSHYIRINTALRFGLDADWNETYSNEE